MNDRRAISAALIDAVGAYVFYLMAQGIIQASLSSLLNGNLGTMALGNEVLWLDGIVLFAALFGVGILFGHDRRTVISLVIAELIAAGTTAALVYSLASEVTGMSFGPFDAGVVAVVYVIGSPDVYLLGVAFILLTSFLSINNTFEARGK